VNSEEYIIMGGDFNQRRSKYRQLGQRLKLVQVLEEGTQTHVKGNHLDDIYTNIDQAKSYTLNEGISDHSGIKINLNINLKRNQKLPA